MANSNFLREHAPRLHDGFETQPRAIVNINEGTTKLDGFCTDRGWNGRPLKSGVNYRLNNKTVVSIYLSGTDEPGTIEIAFEVSSIAALSKTDVSAVNDWIDKLQKNVGSFAKPKTAYSYPRLALYPNQIDRFIEWAQTFLDYNGEIPTEPHDSADTHEEPAGALDELVDKRILASIWSRRGQSAFRQTLLAAYDGKCAVSSCDAEAALEAAHIVPHAKEQSYEVTNGILLRADIHTLFDLYLISVNPETGTVVVANRCQPAYAKYNGIKLELPDDQKKHPDPISLMSHYQNWKQVNGE